jgi:hypothetical protein
MSSLKDFFRKKNRKLKRGPVKTACTYKHKTIGPAVTATYYIQRMIPLVVILGSQVGVNGPTVEKIDNPNNDNS